MASVSESTTTTIVNKTVAPKKKSTAKKKTKAKKTRSASKVEPKVTSVSSNSKVKSTKAKMKTKAKKSKKDEDEFIFLDESYEEEPPPAFKFNSRPRESTANDKGEYDIDDEVALFAGLNSVDEVLYEDVEYQEDLDNLHPAEIAARYQGPQKRVGGSDEQILKDLRKLVFSVPLLHQKEVAKLFTQIDSCVFPTVYTILETSLTSFEEVIQVLIKVAAGNTYGKNIYEKMTPEDLLKIKTAREKVEIIKKQKAQAEEDNEVFDREQELLDLEESLEKPKKKTESRGTYKTHEIRFLTNSYNLFRLFAATHNKEKFPEKKVKTLQTITIKKAMKDCAFIRGVYEDILSNFVEKTDHYEDLHWLALQAKLREDYDDYHRLTDLIIHIDSSLQLNKSAFYVARESKRIYQKYMELRAMIITPYLRSVYSIAKNTARNSHQMLDNFQNGSIGLMRAVSCYSTKRLASFASVAKLWIKQMMLLSIKEDANFVKLPVSTWQAYTQLEKAKVKVGASDESIEEIAKAAKMPVKKAKAVYHTVKIAQVYSLNRTYDSEEKLTLEDIMTNEDRLGGTVDPFGTMLREYCDSADLSDVELKILALRHGMVDLIKNKPMGIDESIKEALVQNLAILGYNFKLHS